MDNTLPPASSDETTSDPTRSAPHSGKANSPTRPSLIKSSYPSNPAIPSPSPRSPIQMTKGLPNPPGSNKNTQSYPINVTPPLPAPQHHSSKSTSPIGSPANSFLTPSNPPVTNPLAGGAPVGMSTSPESVSVPPTKPKPVQYDFRYEDSDTLMAELQEFFSYQEVPQFESKLVAFDDLFKEDWLESSIENRRDFVREILAGLSDGEDESQLNRARCLAYIIEGTFKETTSPEHHLHIILENVKLVREVGGLQKLYNRLKDVSDLQAELISLPDSAPGRGSRGPSPEVPEDMSALNVKIGLYLEIMYFLVEVTRGDEELAEELMALDPPLPVFCLQLLGRLKDQNLRERHPTGYPMRKLLLLTWKSILTCMGGLRDAQKAAALARDLAGLPPPKDDWLGFTKATPTDLLQFRRETSIKYPTFSPEQYREGSSTATAEKLAEALRPIPTRPHYHAPLRDVRADDCFSSLGRLDITHPPYTPYTVPNMTAASNGTTATPAPTPPPSPKPKKQQWQTDQLKPFIFPFSLSAHGDQVLVPSAVNEADKLYKEHIYIPLGLHQLWKEREEYIKEDIGLGENGILGFGVENRTVEEEDEEKEEDEKIAGDAIIKQFREKERELKKEEERAEKAGDIKALKKVREKRLAWKRLDRVEMIYRGVLATALPSTVVVLLKQILASLPPQPAAPPLNGYGNPAVSPGAPDGDYDSPTNAEPKPPPTLAEIDANREREILSKSVSAIILLLLKWFKCSHVLKFQHLSQLLFEMNCPLIIVKTFLLQDSGDMVQAKNEDEEHNFFNYCHQNFSQHVQPSQTSNISSNESGPRRVTTRIGQTTANKHPGAPMEEEVELLSNYSWRNFFGSINRIKIIQKLLKGRTQQIHQFNQYKTYGTFKRALKVQHPMFQLQVLKIIKAQIPHYGKKWKQQNMKIVTAIYLNCRPDLRDEWLVNVLEQDELDWSAAQEAALRSLARFYHHKHYSHIITAASGGSIGAHKGPSVNHPVHINSDPNGPPFSSDFQIYRRVSSSAGQGGDGELFPPNRSRRSSAGTMPMSPSKSPEDFLNTWKHEYEDVLEDVFGEGDGFGRGSPSEGNRAWGLGGGWGPLGGAISHLDLGESWRSGEDGWSDGESSVGTIGDLGERARLDDGEGSQSSERERDDDEVDGEEDGKGEEGDLIDENRNNWEHLSSQTLSAMPKSPIHHPRRRSSGGSPLRPVIKGNGIDGPELRDDEEEEEEELGPAPKGPGGMGDGGSVDEVEFMYGE